MPSVIVDAGLFDATSRLTPKEQASVIEFIRKFHENPATPGTQLHPLTKTKAKNLWSGRVGQDLRIILYKEGDTWALLHVDHHDPAYRWAERRDVSRHPVTGALQIVETIETVREHAPHRLPPEKTPPKAAPIFQDHDDAYLTSLGVPETWLPTLRKIADDDQLLSVVQHLPADVADRLVRLASGELVTPPPPIAPSRPLETAAAASHFYVVEDIDGLTAALAAPLDRWLAFLHPSQKRIVTLDPSGPVKVSGSAGTGKTVVAMHRARHLARAGKRVLVTSFVTTLCENLERNLRRLCTPEEMERITVSTVHKQALALVRAGDKNAAPADQNVVSDALDAAISRRALPHAAAFLKAEWQAVIDTQGILSWGEYRKARRTGRGRPLSVKDRKQIWPVFADTLKALAERDRHPWSILCRKAEQALADSKATSPFDAVLVDEVQDLKPPDLRLLAAVTAHAPQGLLLAGDSGQRIYPGGFSLSALGINVRGRSYVLRLNYRTTEEIRRAADAILAGNCDDMDGGAERRTARSLLRGPAPTLESFPDRKAELEAAAAFIRTKLDAGLAPEAIGCFARTKKRLEELTAVLAAHNIPSIRLSDREAPPGGVHLGTMHRAKGLEFKAVLVFDATHAALPSQGVLRHAVDPADRDAATERERQLLYVAMTRARDELRITWSGEPSAFLAPLLTANAEQAATPEPTPA